MDLATLAANTCGAILSQFYGVVPYVFSLLAVLLGVGLVVALIKVAIKKI